MSSHKSINKNKECCSFYVDQLKLYLESFNYKIIIECNDINTDFALMFYAPAVISNGSSMSFMSGFFGNGIFISEGHFREIDGKIEKNNNHGDWLVEGYSILHKDVKNYYDKEEVLKLLLQ